MSDAFPPLLSDRTTVPSVGTPCRLAPSGPSGRYWVIAESDNTGTIAVGCEPDVTLTHWNKVTDGPRATTGSVQGAPLTASESVVVRVANINQIFIDASIADEGVSWIWLGA